MGDKIRIDKITALDSGMLRFELYNETKQESYCLFVSADELNGKLEKQSIIRCKECEHWHEETGWCEQHSHFIKDEGEFCYPHESSSWKMFDENYFCGDAKIKEA